MLTVALVLIVVGWALVVAAVLGQLPHLRGVRMRGRSTRVPTRWSFVVLLVVGISCCEVGVQLGRHRSLGSWGFLIAYVPVFAFVAITAAIHNRRLRSNPAGGGGK